ncbi:penicillin-binding transpeptidase domain-containing protein [Streptomyces sp. NPDC059582]|uniref:penicillin-binding transpeptidase domain-containing protein n=1 Tax=Streptomyces sp. NPDC059582 TaxID=3346875 RepID=UPI00369739FE
MHATITGALRVSGVLAALAVLATGCGEDSHPDSADKPSTGSRSPSSAHRGLGDILVGGKAVTGSKATGDTRIPYRRTYSAGSLYAPVTGYRSMLYGRTGLEALYDDVLAAGGASGDVVTTIDPAAQKAAFDALGDRQGAAVALDAESGKLLAVVSTPSYDPAAFSGRGPEDVRAWKTANGDADAPLLDRALRQADAPGATFAVVVAAAALEQGLYPTVDEATSSPLTYVLPLTRTRVTGASPQCANASIRVALRRSCDNVFTKMAADLGADQVRTMAEEFGFNDDALTVPLRVSESTYPAAGSTASQTALTGIGAGEVAATPLEMARVAASVVNGGRLVNPSLVSRVTKSDGGTRQPGAAAGPAGQVISRRTADALRSVLDSATDTGISGQAGETTDGRGGSAGAWFIGYTDRGAGRRIAVAVRVGALASPAGEGDEAARVAERILATVS